MKDWLSIGNFTGTSTIAKIDRPPAIWSCRNETSRSPTGVGCSRFAIRCGSSRRAFFLNSCSVNSTTSEAPAGKLQQSCDALMKSTRATWHELNTDLENAPATTRRACGKRRDGPIFSKICLVSASLIFAYECSEPSVKWTLINNGG